MEIDPETHDRSMYRTMTGLVVPRPIAWISTVDADGIDNLAPYSFFNVVNISPPMVMFAPATREDGPTDTAENVRETEEFVVNVVTNEFAKAMNETSATLPSTESEFDHADLRRSASTRVAPPRVDGVAAAFECTLHDRTDLGSNSLVVGEVVYAHVCDDIVTANGKVDTAQLEVIGRLAGSSYDRITDRFVMERPD